MFTSSDEAILGLCAHGKAAEIDKSIFKPEWLENPLIRSAVQASINLAREGREVNAISVIAKAKISDRQAVPEIMRIFRNGFGEASMEDAVEHSFQRYTLRRAVESAEEIQRLAKDDPNGVKRWLPQQTTSIVQLLRDGEAYDPRPSHHAMKTLPRIFTTSLIENMNDLLRGGYRDGFLKIYAGVTKHGKSVTLTSHAIDLILQKYKVCIVRTENTEQAAVAEIAAAMTGISLENEIYPDKFAATAYESPEERKLRYQRMLQYLDEYLEVYDYKWCSDDKLKQIARWSKPNAILIDYLKKQPGLFSRRSGSQDEVGDFADWLLVFAKENGIWLGTAGQISQESAKKLVKFDNSEPVILYGTARVGQAADEFTFLKRHNTLKDHAYFRVQLDRYTGRLDTIHVIPFDVQRRILKIPRLIAPQLTEA